MKADDLDNAAELVQAGLLPLKAAVWALVRFRSQRGLDVTATEVMERFGASRSAAYRAIADVAELAKSQPSTVPHIGTNAVPESGTERPGKRDKQSHISGQSVPESGTQNPGKWDCTNDKRVREKESVCSPRAHACEEPDSEPIPNGPSPEADRQAVVRFVGDVTAGALDSWASQVCQVYPADWVRALVERKVLGQPLPRATLLNAILQAWARSGSCEYLDQPTIPLRPTGTAHGSPSAPRSIADRRIAALRADTDSWELPNDER